MSTFASRVALYAAPMTSRHALMFYLLVPLVLAMLNGARGSVHAPELPTYRTVLLWIAVSAPTWWVADALCRLAYASATRAGLRVARAGQIAILAGGGVLAGAVGYFYIGVLLTATGEFFGDFQNRLAPGGFVLARPLSDVVFSLSTFTSVVIWTSINLVFDRLANVPRFRTPAEMPAALAVAAQHRAAAQPPAFITKLPAHLGRDILAVEAEEHYIKVHTPRGSDLVLYKFKDALAELSAHDGLQVHRSHWIARAAVASVDRSTKPVRLVLSNGLSVPVAQARVSALEVAGIIQRAAG